MPKLTLLVGPPGSGKSTMAKNRVMDDPNLVYVNQDSQGADHMDVFFDAVIHGKDILVDRMNFNKQQRAKYLDYAKFKNLDYETEIVVFHQPYAVCLERVRARFGNHETINEEKAARGALQTFFTKYERPTVGEANELTFIYPESPKALAVYSDLDGTLCNVEHRRHFVRPPANTLVGPDGSMVNVLGIFEPVEMDAVLPKFKKNWKAFFDGIPNDTVNRPIMDILNKFKDTHKIVYCTGRDDNYRKVTTEWLEKHSAPSGELFMRNRQDSRQDAVVKEILLDFEILTRYNILFCLDDRDQVVKMLRSRGLTVLQVANGDF